MFQNTDVATSADRPSIYIDIKRNANPQQTFRAPIPCAIQMLIAKIYKKLQSFSRIQTHIYDYRNQNMITFLSIRMMCSKLNSDLIRYCEKSFVYLW